MHLPVYGITTTPDKLIYWFVSKGPNGEILKAIFYQPLSAPNRFNFGFGDVDSKGNISDVVMSGNADLRKVLATVAQTLYSFFDQYPDKTVQFQGTDARRNITYFRIIRDYGHEVAEDFTFEGRRKDGNWEPFNPNQDYSEIRHLQLDLTSIHMATTTVKKTPFNKKDIQVSSDVPFNHQAPFFQDKKDRAEKILAESIQTDSAFAERIEREQGR